MTVDDVELIVGPFYKMALTVNTTTTPTAVLEKLLAEDFQSLNSQEAKSKPALIKQVEGFWKLIPDLKWEPQDVMVAGSKAVVRSIASGTPKGPFMGMTLDGTRAFKIDTIDIHELEGGHIMKVAAPGGLGDRA